MYSRVPHHRSGFQNLLWNGKFVPLSEAQPTGLYRTVPRKIAFGVLSRSGEILSKCCFRPSSLLRETQIRPVLRRIRRQVGSLYQILARIISQNQKMHADQTVREPTIVQSAADGRFLRSWCSTKQGSRVIRGFRKYAAGAEMRGLRQ